MPKNLLDQLAEIDIPAPPRDFDQRVHQRLNISLLLGQFSDFILRGFPYALFHFLQALAGLVEFTLTGRFHDKPRDKPD